MSHADHKIIRCARCGVVKTQCRCIGPKPTHWENGPCPVCLYKSDDEAKATFDTLMPGRR